MATLCCILAPTRPECPALALMSYRPMLRGHRMILPVSTSACSPARSKWSQGLRQLLATVTANAVTSGDDARPTELESANAQVGVARLVCIE
jgi:hypothetical protein